MFPLRSCVKNTHKERNYKSLKNFDFFLRKIIKLVSKNTGRELFYGDFWFAFVNTSESAICYVTGINIME